MKKIKVKSRLSLKKEQITNLNKVVGGKPFTSEGGTCVDTKTIPWCGVKTLRCE